MKTINKLQSFQLSKGAKIVSVPFWVISLSFPRPYKIIFLENESWDQDLNCQPLRREGNEIWSLFIYRKLIIDIIIQIILEEKYFSMRMEKEKSNRSNNIRKLKHLQGPPKRLGCPRNEFKRNREKKKSKKTEKEAKITHALVMVFSYNFEPKFLNISGSPSHFNPC